MTKGASFFAANFSSSFRIRPLFLLDGLNVPINLKLYSITDLEVKKTPKIKKEINLFPIKAKFGSKRAFSFTKNKDLELVFHYPNE